jgi:ketosteroid isomerase-like protein
MFGVETTMRLFLGVVLLIVFSATHAMADATDDVMKADRDFAALAQTKGVAEAFAAYAAPDAHWFVPGPEPLRGPEAIKARLAKSFAGGGTLEWAPTRAWASVDGTMAVTWGRSIYTSPKDAAGKTSVSHGSYLSVWMKQPDGSWKFSHDMGTTDPTPKP